MKLLHVDPRCNSDLIQVRNVMMPWSECTRTHSESDLRDSESRVTTSEFMLTLTEFRAQKAVLLYCSGQSIKYFQTLMIIPVSVLQLILHWQQSVSWIVFNATWKTHQVVKRKVDVLDLLFEFSVL